MSDYDTIPLCNDEFLQDVSIEFGLRLKRRAGYLAFHAQAKRISADEEEPRETLSVWVWTPYKIRIGVVIEDDGTVWIQVALEATENVDEYSVEFDSDFQGLSPAQIAEAFFDTLSVSTKLCYGESPLPILRKIWKHSGKCKISGSLKRTRAETAG